MNFLKNVISIVFGIVWALLWLLALKAVTNDADAFDSADVRVLQTVCFFLMFLGVVAFGMGIARIVR
jgi:hypothetical protein